MSTQGIDIEKTNISPVPLDVSSNDVRSDPHVTNEILCIVNQHYPPVSLLGCDGLGAEQVHVEQGDSPQSSIPPPPAATTEHGTLPAARNLGR